MDNYFSIKEKLYNAEINTKNPPSPFHTHTFYEMVYLESGNMTFYFNEITIEMNPGDFILFPPYSFHKEIWNANESKSYVIHFPSSFISRAFSPQHAKRMMQFILKPFPLKFCGTDSKKVSHIISSLQKYSSPSKWKEGCIYFVQLFCILGNYVKHADYSPDSLSSKIILFLNEHISKKITVDRIAKHLYMSRSNLEKQFLAETGNTVAKFIHYYRINRAALLLSRSNYPINKICTICGFTSQAYFSQFFKKEMGENPLEFRQRFKEELL